MKNRFLATLVLLTMLLSLTPSVAAHRTEFLPVTTPLDFPVSPELTVSSDSEPETEARFWVIFSVPTLEEIQQTEMPLDYPVYFQKIAQPALEVLRHLQASGKVSRFEENLENWGLTVWLTDQGRLEDLQTVPGVAEIRQADAPDVCSANPAAAVRDVLQAAQAQQAQSQLQAPQTLAALADALPTIQIWIDSYVSYGTRYSYLSGSTTPNTPVHIRVENRERDVVVEQTVTSTSYGYYWLSPSWQTCEGYGWSLSAGQMVIVTANGKTAAMQVPLIQGTTNPDADIVQGQTAANRDIMIRVWPNYTGCQTTSYTDTLKTGSDGTFQFNLTAKGGFDHSGLVLVYVYDSNRNFAYTSFIVPQVYVIQRYNRVYGYVTRPGSYVTVKLQRSGSLIATREVSADASGYFYVDFEMLRAYDRLIVESVAEVMQYEIAPMSNVLVDWLNGRITGTTIPGRRVKSSVWFSDCGYSSSCDATAANISGNFTLLLPSAILLRTEPSVYVYDEQGHYQYDWYNSPYVRYIAYPNGSSYSYSYVGGYWYPGVTSLTVRIYDGTTLESEYTSVGLSSDLYYSVYINRLLPAGRRIEVSDGTRTRTLIIRNLTARLDANTNKAFGIAPLGHLLDVRADYSYPPALNSYTTRRNCNVSVASNGFYEADFSDWYNDLQVKDRVYVESFESDGDRNTVYGYDLSIRLAPWSSNTGMNINGRKADPQQVVSVEVRAANGTLRGTDSYSDVPNSWYYASFNFTPQLGDVVTVRNGVHTAVFTIPPLTVNESPQENRLYGIGPASKTVYPYLYLPGRWIYWHTSVLVNPNGAYSASFKYVYPTYWWWDGCSQTTVGGCRQSGILYYDANGHRYETYNQMPAPVSTDRYDTGDDDNAPARASVYTAIQSHTFHRWDDVDWIAYNVPAAHVGRVHSFHTLNLGDIARTSLYLYDSNTVTLLTSYTGPEDAAVIRWTPTHAGWHYIKVTPRSYTGSQIAASSNASITGGGGGGGDYYYCGATYDFQVKVEAEWTALFYMSGDSDLGLWAGRARRDLERAVGSLVNVNIVLLWDGTDTITGDTWRYLVQSKESDYRDGENRWYIGELNLGDGKVLADFLKWGMERYPASHYYVNIANHGLGHAGISWDFNTYVGENAGGKAKHFGNSDRIEPLELREALQRATQGGANKIDILHYDACLMGLWEHAYQIKDFVDYLVFSQNQGWSVFAFDQYARALQGHNTRAVATEIARLYSQRVEEKAKPYTISVADLSKMVNLRQAVDQLAVALEGGMGTFKQLLKESRDATQTFDSNGNVILTKEDSYLDLYDFATQVKQRITNTAVQNAATAVQNAVTQSVVVEYHQAGVTQDRDGVAREVALVNPHGLSIYYPERSGPIFKIYAAGQMFQTTVDSRWADTLVEYYGVMGLPPTMSDPDDVNPWAWKPDMPTIYLPLVMKQ